MHVFCRAGGPCGQKIGVPRSEDEIERMFYNSLHSRSVPRAADTLDVRRQSVLRTLETS